MDKELIFIGGSKGVGKTSLAKAISSQLDFEYINTGERFRKYRPFFDDLFCQELINLKHSRVIIDTHYVASSSKTPYNFHIGIDEMYQRHLKSYSKYKGKIILVEANPLLVLERRKQDTDCRRCFELEQITLITPLLLIILHLSQIFLMDDFTFILFILYSCNPTLCL